MAYLFNQSLLDAIPEPHRIYFIPVHLRMNISHSIQLTPQISSAASQFPTQNYKPTGSKLIAFSKRPHQFTGRNLVSNHIRLDILVLYTIFSFTVLSTAYAQDPKFEGTSSLDSRGESISAAAVDSGKTGTVNSPVNVRGDVSIGISKSGPGTLIVSDGRLSVSQGVTAGDVSSVGNVVVHEKAFHPNESLTVGRGSGGPGRLMVLSGTAHGNQDVFIGVNGGVGVAQFEGGQIETPNISVGSNATGNVRMKGGAIQAQNISIGERAGDGTWIHTDGTIHTQSLSVGLEGTGYVQVSGGQINTSKTVSVGDSKGDGTINLTGGDLNTGNFVVGNDEATGKVTISNGTVNTGTTITVGKSGGSGTWDQTNGKTNTKDFTVGDQAKGNVTMSGGTMSAKGQLIVGTHSGDGKWLQTGGTTSVGTVQLGEQGGCGTMNIRDNSTLHVNDLLAVGGNLGSGALVVTGKVNTSRLELSSATSQKGNTVTLNDGGVISTNAITAHHPDDTLKIDGGTLQAKSDNSHYISGFSSGRILLGSKGGIIDTDRFSIRIASDIRGLGGLSVIGSGWLALSGNHIYEGATQANSRGFSVEGQLSTASLELSPGTSPKGTTIVLNDGALISTHAITAHHPDDTLKIDGGTLRAKRNNPRFISGFSSGRILLGRKGGIIDTDRFSIRIASDIRGLGGLSVIGSGRLTLSGNHIYEGATQANSRELSVEGQLSTASLELSPSKSPKGTTVVLNDGGLISTNAITAHHPDDTLKIDGGTLQAKSDNSHYISGFSSGRVRLESKGVIFDPNRSSVGIESNMSGPGGLSVAGPGRLILLSDQTYEGATRIRSGELSVRRRLASPHVSTERDGILSGSGILAGDVVNSGRVSPGDSIGTLTIQGNYTQTATGTLWTEVSGSKADLLSIGGSAHLAGTLHVEALSAPSATEGYSILNAQSGISGKFDEVTSSENLLVDVFYDSNEVLLLILGVGDPLRMISLEKFTPRTAGIIKDILFNVANTQYGQLTTRLAAIRSGVGGVTLQGLSQEPMVQQYKKRILLSQSNPILVPVNQDLHWDIWASASGIFSTINHVQDLQSLKSLTGYFSVGADYRINRVFDVGIYTGYQTTRANYRDGRLRSNGMKYGIYGTAQWEGFYINAILGG